MKNTGMKPRFLRYGKKFAVICFWLLLWEFLSIRVNQEILIASPAEVVTALLVLAKSLDFWQTILFSFTRIVLGFILAVSAGSLLAVISYQSTVIKELILPVMKIIKTIPVASFIILALVWIDKENLSVLISLLMVLPVIYINFLEGLLSTDEKLLQMAEVFDIRAVKKIHAIYIPAVLPHFVSAVSIGLGFCWKAGIAAEVIGIPSGSIGERLYEAKLYLMTKELFAWTIVIILISIVFEKTIMWAIGKLMRRSGR